MNESRVSFASSAPAAAPVRTCVFGGRTVLDLLEQRRVRDAGLRRDVDLVELARLVEERLRGREVEDRERRAAEVELAAAELDDARRCVNRCTGPSA